MEIDLETSYMKALHLARKSFGNDLKNVEFLFRFGEYNAFSPCFWRPLIIGLPQFILANEEEAEWIYSSDRLHERIWERIPDEPDCNPGITEEVINLARNLGYIQVEWVGEEDGYLFELRNPPPTVDTLYPKYLLIDEDGKLRAATDVEDEEIHKRLNKDAFPSEPEFVID